MKERSGGLLFLPDLTLDFNARRRGLLFLPGLTLDFNAISKCPVFLIFKH